MPAQGIVAQRWQLNSSERILNQINFDFLRISMNVCEIYVPLTINSGCPIQPASSTALKSCGYSLESQIPYSLGNKPLRDVQTVIRRRNYRVST